MEHGDNPPAQGQFLLGNGESFAIIVSMMAGCLAANPPYGLILKKMLAEATLFKSLFVLYLVTIFLLFLIFEQCFITNMLCYSLLGIIPFLMFAIDRNIKVQERLDNFK